MQILIALGAVEIIGTVVLCVFRGRPGHTGWGVSAPRVAWLSPEYVATVITRVQSFRLRRPDRPSPRGVDIAEPVGVSDSGRHHVPDELLTARTYRLAADRLARARVHGS